MNFIDDSFALKTNDANVLINKQQKKLRYTKIIEIEEQCKENGYNLSKPSGNWKTSAQKFESIIVLKDEEEICDLQYFGMKEFPKELMHFKFVKILHLEDNHLSVLPGELHEMENLISLHLDNNRLTDIPISKYLPRTLETLNMSNNNISKVSNVFFSKMKKLKFVDLHNNFIDRITFKGKNNLKVLDLSKNHLKECPQNVNNCIHLSKLDISHNKIIRICGSFKFSHLVDLDASNNEIQKIQEKFFHDNKLLHVNLSHNFIADLHGIEHLKYLTKLVITNNYISSFPSNIGKMKKIKVIVANDCKLKIIPLEILECKQLTKLDIRDNPRCFIHKMIMTKKHFKLLMTIKRKHVLHFDDFHASHPKKQRRINHI